MIELGRGKVISATQMKENPGAYPVYSSSAHNNGLMGTYGNYMFDQELITWSIDGGGAVFFRPRHKFSVTNVCGFIICKKQIDTPFLAYQMNNIHSIMGFDYVHKAHPSVIRTLYTLGIPSIDEQKKIGSFFVHIDSTIALCQRKLDLLTQAKKALMQQIFSQKLRFKADDGSDFPEWEEKKLGDIGEVITGSTPSTKHKEYFGNEILWATPVDLNEQLVLKNTTRKLSRLGYSKGRKLPEGSVLVSCIATIGKVGVLPVPGSCNQQLNAIIPETDVDSYWLGYAMRLKKPTLEMLGGNGGLKIVNKTLFENIHISIPSLPEQQKIAACLSSADALVDQARAELEQWQEVKKSLLQQMFV